MGSHITLIRGSLRVLVSLEMNGAVVIEARPDMSFSAALPGNLTRPTKTSIRSEDKAPSAKTATSTWLRNSAYLATVV